MNKNRLFHRDFALVVIGQIISLFGNAILRFALPLYLLNITGSSSVYGTVLALSMIPMIVLSPVGGIIADRVNKRNIMVILDFTTAALVLIFTLTMSQMNLVVLMTITMMLLCGIQAAYQPAVQASLPALADPVHLLSANAVINQVSSLAGLLGPIIGGILLGSFGLLPILLLGIVCFTCSAIMEIFIHIPFERQPVKTRMLTMVISDFRESVTYIRKDNPTILKVMVIVAVFNLFLTSMLIVGFPVLITQTLGLSLKLCGYAEGALAFGGLCGGILTGILSKKLQVSNSHLLLLAATVFTLPVGIALLLSAPVMVTYLLITVCSFLLMASATMFTVQTLSYLQSVTPPHLIGKVISFAMTLSMCAQPIGQGMYGFLFDLLKNQTWVIILGTVLISAIVTILSARVFRTLKNA
ncbi:MFS transporter [Diplocloster hominis]|uniref:MFS transporter n=1 Tax=Diplocloster hominis TaxID=3079010 RepID=UPI0031BAF232